MILVDTDDPVDVVLRAPAVLATVRAGRLVHALAGPTVT